MCTVQCTPMVSVSLSPCKYWNRQNFFVSRPTEIFIISWKCYNDAIKWILLCNTYKKRHLFSCCLLLLLLPSSACINIHVQVHCHIVFVFVLWFVNRAHSRFKFLNAIWLWLLIIILRHKYTYTLRGEAFNMRDILHGQRISGNLRNVRCRYLTLGCSNPVNYRRAAATDIHCKRINMNSMASAESNREHFCASIQCKCWSWCETVRYYVHCVHFIAAGKYILLHINWTPFRQ